MLRAEDNVIPIGSPKDGRRPRRMRARRHRIADLKIGEIRARLFHFELGEVAAVAEDVSLHGLAIAVPQSDEEQRVVLIGDRIDRLSLHCANEHLYQGTATVRRVAERDGERILGLELDSSGIDLDRVHRYGRRLEFAKRWDQMNQAARYPHIASAFKALVGRVRSFLENAQRFLEAEERALADEDLRTAEQSRGEYLAVVVPDMKARINGARLPLAQLVESLSAEQHAEYRAYGAMHLNPFLKQSPFVRRALEKPLGYAGDYEMMNMLYRDPAEGETLLGKAINVCFTEEPAAQANKNRIDYIGSLIRKTLAQHPVGRVRVASIGCGPAREIQTLLETAPELGPRLDVALVDQEERAIAHCEQTLAPLAAAEFSACCTERSSRAVSWPSATSRRTTPRDGSWSTSRNGS